jgi:hypothetical protein
MVYARAYQTFTDNVLLVLETPILCCHQIGQPIEAQQKT